MRTTINLNDHLLADLKKRAAESGRTMTAIIEDALRQAVAPSKAAVRRKVRLTTVGGKGVRPGVDLDDSAALLDLMDRRK